MLAEKILPKLSVTLSLSRLTCFLSILKDIASLAALLKGAGKVIAMPTRFDFKLISINGALTLISLAQSALP